MICIDRGYTEYGWWEELSAKGVYFVTRLKNNALYEQIRLRAGRRSKNMQDDETIILKGTGIPLRLIHYTDPVDNHEYHSITIATDWTIADGRLSCSLVDQEEPENQDFPWHISKCRNDSGVDSAPLVSDSFLHTIYIQKLPHDQENSKLDSY